ncbi:MAG: hypothetical protein WA047_00380, partial [Phenylobacterium sp.]|uniref:hypothetical protein n=1 Tax=Phenylobacterium sp. TaxID=1871053 RepID=UPI003BB5C465
MEDGWSAGQARLAGLSTDSQMVVAAQSGHAIAQTEPDLVAEVIGRVVGKVRKPTRSLLPLREKVAGQRPVG